jgi:hypothetical protein
LHGRDFDSIPSPLYSLQWLWSCKHW